MAKLTGDERAEVLRLAKLMGDRHNLLAAEWVMQRFGILTFGIERVDSADRFMRYVNTGETYDSTVYYEDDECAIGSWGDWLETAETEFDEENDTVKCGYCSHHTPKSEPWDSTVCEQCGRNVSSGEKPAKYDDRVKPYLMDNGKLQSFAFPGGYPIYYLTADCAALCPDCANQDDVNYADKHDKQWHIIGADINYEDGALYCEHCNKRIESAYAEDSAEDSAE